MSGLTGSLILRAEKTAVSSCSSTSTTSRSAADALAQVKAKGYAEKWLRCGRKVTLVEDCTVITWGDERMTEDGIRIVPVWKWLLET